MTNKIAKKTFSMPRGQELSDLTAFCKVMADSPFYRRLGAGGVMSIVLTAKELNLPMMPCLNGGMHNVEGKVTLSAQLMNAMILMNGHRADLKELNKEKCVIEFKRNDSEDAVLYTYTIEEARTAGYLSKNNWKTHVKDMLYCRCLSGGARKVMPDVIMGCYISGELGEAPFSSDDEPNLEFTNQEQEHDNQSNEIDEGEINEYIKSKQIGEDNMITEYVNEISSVSNKSKNEIIRIAYKNQEEFEEAFLKWIQQNKEGNKI